MMKQRFAIRLGSFFLFSLIISAILGLGKGAGGYFTCTFFILCLVYSGRLLWSCFSPALGTLAKLGFLAIIFGSIPGVLIILIAFVLMGGILTTACFVLGCIQMGLELFSAIRADSTI